MAIGDVEKHSDCAAHLTDSQHPLPLSINRTHDSIAKRNNGRFGT